MKKVNVQKEEKKVKERERERLNDFSRNKILDFFYLFSLFLSFIFSHALEAWLESLFHSENGKSCKLDLVTFVLDISHSSIQLLHYLTLFRNDKASVSEGRRKTGENRKQIWKNSVSKTKVKNV